MGLDALSLSKRIHHSPVPTYWPSSSWVPIKEDGILPSHSHDPGVHRLWPKGTATETIFPHVTILRYLSLPTQFVHDKWQARLALVRNNIVYSIFRNAWFLLEFLEHFWNSTGRNKGSSSFHIKTWIKSWGWLVQFRMISCQTTTNFGIVTPSGQVRCILAMIPLSSFVTSKIKAVAPSLNNSKLSFCLRED